MAKPLRFQSTNRTHVGRVRLDNEDALVDRPTDGVWAVADGMGGHQGGALAAGLIAQTLIEFEASASVSDAAEAAGARLAQVNQQLVAQAADLGPGAVIGSTVVALLANGRRYACLWAGDSRCYLLRRGRFTRLSHDHSLVQEMLDRGELRPEEARGHRRSNVITRAVGVFPRLELDLVEGEAETGDLFLLCSDGLTVMLDDQEIADVLNGADLDSVADRLIQATLDRGARDNVTVVLIRAVEDLGRS